MKKKKLIPILLSFSLIFGTIFANAISINFEDIETDDISIEYEELKTEESVIENIDSSEATETEELIIEPELIELEPVQNYALRSSNFDITLTAHSEGYGSVSLDWGGYDYKDKNFKVYKSSDGGITYETVGIDYTLVDEVKVLNLYPTMNSGSWPVNKSISFTSSIDEKTYNLPKSASLKMWMEQANSEHQNGYGRGIIKVDAVPISTFNSNYTEYLSKDYDVIMVGTWNGNGGEDLSSASIPYIEKWIKSGKGFISGHDTIRMATQPLGTIKHYFGITGYGSNKYGTGDGKGLSFDKIEITTTGLFTMYPWYIGKKGDTLTVPNTHTSGEIYSSDTKIWLKWSGRATNNTNVFLASKNNVAHIQTGDGNCAASVDEQKILANMLFYLNQLIFNRYDTKDSSAQDFANPNAPTANTSGSNFTWSATDNGSTYHYYVQSFDKNDTTETGLLDTSVTKSLTVTTGVRKYRYILDNSSSTIVTLSNGTETIATSIPENRSYNYLHIAAIDGAGNIGPTTTVEIPKTANVTVNHYKMNLDGSTYTLANTATETAIIGTNYSGFVKTYTGFTSPAVQTKTIVSGTNTINYYYTRNKYTVTYIDKTSDGKELGRTTKQVFYDTNVRGSELGSNSSDNAYYLQYKYISDTNATVTTNNTTVYRNFEFCKTEAVSNLKWNDSNNKDGFRPSKYKLKLKQNGVKINEIELSSETLRYSFTNLPKYDTAGRQYQYTFDVDATERYNISLVIVNNCVGVTLKYY